MKQNERFLVYLVMGFLALILVVAVMFSRDPAKDAGVVKSQGLNQILGQEDGGKDGGKLADKESGTKGNVALDPKSDAGKRVGLPSPSEVSPQQPLMAGGAATNQLLLAADLVAQQFGPSRRDRMARWVRAKQNDTVELLVRRWCGTRDPYLAEAMSLNEELKVLRVGQEIMVPWVEDDVLVAAIDAQKPKTLMPQDGLASGAGTKGGTAVPATNDSKASGPTFAMPGTGTVSGTTLSGTTLSGTTLSGNPPSTVDADASKRVPALNAAVAGSTSYTTKPGDSLWRICERTYGRKNADRMIPVVKQANPGMTDKLGSGQKIVLPAAPTAAAAPTGA